MKLIHVFAAIALLASGPSFASVVEFTDRSEWEAAVGAFTTIDFVLPPSGTPITDQYRHMGVTFGDLIFSHATGSYINDGWGMRGVGGAWVYFDTPQRWLGLDHPGITQVNLYNEGTLMHTTMIFGGSGTGFFGGVISSVEFDTVYIFKPEPHINNIFIDDLHFGNFVPAHGALGLLGLYALFAARRRRA